VTETTRGSLHIEGEEPLYNSARVQPHTSCLVKDVRRPCAQPPGCSARRAIEDFAAGRKRHDYEDSPRAHCAYSSIVCLSEGRLSHGLVFSPVHVEASCIVCRREVRVNRKQRGAMQSPHEGGGLFCLYPLAAVPIWPDAVGTRRVSNKFRDQHNLEHPWRSCSQTGEERSVHTPPSRRLTSPQVRPSR